MEKHIVVNVYITYLYRPYIYKSDIKVHNNEEA